MSRHAWLSLNLAHQTLDRGLEAFVWARRAEATTDQALAFAGYLVERDRQSTRRPTLGALWQGARRSNFRFTRGSNAENYDRLGRRIVGQALQVMCARQFAGPSFLPPDLPTVGGGDPLLSTLIRQWEEGGDFYPLRDYIEEQGPVMAHMLSLLERGNCPVGTWPF
jgi:hypothetical protein